MVQLKENTAEYNIEVTFICICLSISRMHTSQQTLLQQSLNKPMLEIVGMGMYVHT
jgi:hypothetical protein